MKIGILGLLALIFVVAKLAGLVAWSWPVVLVPVIALVLLRIVVFGVVAVAAIMANS